MRSYSGCAVYSRLNTLHIIFWLNRMLIKRPDEVMSTSLRHFSLSTLYNLKVKMSTLPQFPPCLKVLASRKLVLASEIKVVTSHWASEKKN